MTIPVPPGGSGYELLRADGHIHSTFSDGASDPVANLRAAVAAGLTDVVMADHVRAATDWLPGFVAAIDALRMDAPLRVRIGVETKLLDTRGVLDLPARLEGVELLLIADHQLPTPAGPVGPAAVRADLERGVLDAGTVTRGLLQALTAAVGAARLPAVLVHPFSILAKIGLDDTQLPEDALRRLADRCRETGTAIEINEKWRCPTPANVRWFADAGVRVVAGSDAHDSDAVGRYRYVRDVVESLSGTATLR